MMRSASEVPSNKISINITIRIISEWQCNTEIGFFFHHCLQSVLDCSICREFIIFYLTYLNMLTKYIHVMISTKDMPYYLYISPECFVFLKAIPWGQSNGYYYFYALSPSFSVVESQLCTINTSRSLLVTLLNSPCCLNCTLTSLPILLKLFNFNRVDFRITNLIDWFWTVFSYLKGPTWPCMGFC